MLPVQAVASGRQEPAEKEFSPPTLFDFEGQKAADLSFNKGAIIDLTHTVNENWLEGRLSQANGIFPTAYEQVLSHEQLRELLSQEKAPLLQAVAAYDFQFQSEKELSFKKGDVIVITKKVDANWFEGYISDRTSIFPSSYVTIAYETQQQIDSSAPSLTFTHPPPSSPSPSLLSKVHTTHCTALSCSTVQ